MKGRMYYSSIDQIFNDIERAKDLGEELELSLQPLTMLKNYIEEAGYSRDTSMEEASGVISTASYNLSSIIATLEKMNDKKLNEVIERLENIINDLDYAIDSLNH